MWLGARAAARTITSRKPKLVERSHCNVASLKKRKKKEEKGNATSVLVSTGFVRPIYRVTPDNSVEFNDSWEMPTILSLMTVKSLLDS